jgi:hypothetical protein
VTDFDDAYPRLTHTIKLNLDSLTIRSETGEGLAEGLKSAAEVAADLAAGGAVIKAAFGISDAKPEPKAANSAPPKAAPTTKQGRTYGKTVKPGPAVSKEADGDTCAHGKPWNDLNGGRNKENELYRRRFYNTCGNQECRAWGDQE